jgi:hypothetical protein
MKPDAFLRRHAFVIALIFLVALGTGALLLIAALVR